MVTDAAVAVGDWVRVWAVEEVFGIEPALLNDDRLARALDVIASHLDQLAGTVGPRAIAEFGVDVSRFHWDMTSMSVHGAYVKDDRDNQFAVIKYGHLPGPLYRPEADPGQDRGHRRRRGPRRMPRVFDGGAAEVGDVVDAMKDLRNSLASGSS
ncbi:hypothetical protein ACWD7F_36740 [Streptomyces sp. NPDC005122]